MENMPDRTALLAELEQERAALLPVLARFDDTQWHTLARDDGWTVHDIANHLADATYGLSLIAQGQGGTAPITDLQTGQVNPGAYNEQRREKNRTLPREKIMRRMDGAFAQAQQAIAAADDMAMPVAFGPNTTRGMLLQRIINHLASHRAELEALR